MTRQRLVSRLAVSVLLCQNAAAQSQPDRQLPRRSPPVASAETSPAQRTPLRPAEPTSPEPSRLFAAHLAEIGFNYLRSEFATGYRPNPCQQVSIRLLSELSDRAVQAGADALWSNCWASLRLGAGWTQSAKHNYLPVNDHYTRAQLETRPETEHATYRSLRAALGLRVPWGSSNLEGRFEVVALGGVPATQYLFEESLRAVTGGRWILTSSMSYLWPQVSLANLSVRLVVEDHLLPDRNVHLWRAGVRAALQTVEHLTVSAHLLPTIAGPDALGRVGSELELGLMWAWGEPSAARGFGERNVRSSVPPDSASPHFMAKDSSTSR